MTGPLVPSQLSLIQDLQLVTYTRLAATFIIFYDYWITFDREVNFIWSSKWSIPKALFLLIRYYAILNTMFEGTLLVVLDVSDQIYRCMYFLFITKLDVNGYNQNRCTLYVRWESFSTLITAILAQGILQIRIYALYSRSKGILALMLTCYAIVTAFAGWTFFSNVGATTSVVVYVPGGNTCSFPDFPPLLYAFWITMLGFEGILCALALYRGYQTVRDGLPRQNGLTLIDVIIRDSAMIFIVLAATYIACLVVFLKAPINLSVIPAGFSISLSVVLGCRLILNLREAAVDRTENTIPLSTLVIGGDDPPSQYTTYSEV